MEIKIHWRTAMNIAKKGKQVPDNLIDYDDENNFYDQDCLPFTKDDILSGKIVKTENLIILSEVNYNWLTQLTKNQSISEKVNLILNYFRQENIQVQGV